MDRFILLMWLSLLIMTPFKLTRFSEAEAVWSRVVALESHCAAAGIDHSAAALLLSRLLTRTDSLDALPPFVAVRLGRLAAASLSLFERRGLLALLCAIYKHGPRAILAPTVLAADVAIFGRPDANPLVQRLVCKLVTRMALAVLAPRVCAWRYDRGCRSLTDPNSVAARSEIVSR